MKRLPTLILTMILLCSVCVLGQGKINYYATANINFHLRKTPSKEGRKVVQIIEDETVAVLRVDGEWALCQKGNSKGYAYVEWLRRYRPLNAYKHPIPGTTRQTGLAVMKLPAMLATEGVVPSVLLPGDVVAVHNVQGQTADVNIWQGKSILQNSAFEYTPFPKPEDALPGEAIAAFTTFWNKDTGRRLHDNRVFNIHESARRIDNVMIEPAGSFSFNAYCAPYRKSNGYLLAPNISQDGSGYGGGVCQVSTTLLLAVAQLPVCVDKWELHSSYGVPYAPLWLDSAVGNFSDLAFTNQMPYAIRLSAKAQQDCVTVVVYRTD